MTTIENIYDKITELNEKYEELVELNRKASNNISLPLYSNGKCWWDCTTPKSKEDLQYDPNNPDTNKDVEIINMGNASIGDRSLGTWCNLYMFDLAQSTGNTNPKTTLPTHFHVFKMRVNGTESMKKTVFIRATWESTYSHGYKNAWLCTTDTDHSIKKWIGGGCPDTGTSGTYGSLQYDMFNVNANNGYGYHSWVGYNVDLEEEDIDEDGFIYIGYTCTNSTHYVSGVGIADRNYNMRYTNGRAINNACLPTRGITFSESNNNSNFCNSSIPRATTYSNSQWLEIPYDSVSDDGLLLTFLGSLYSAVNTSNADMKLILTDTGETVRRTGDYISKWKQWVNNVNGSLYLFNGDSPAYYFTKQQVINNTVEYFGLKFLKVRPNYFWSNQDMWFVGIVTEEI